MTYLIDTHCHLNFNSYDDDRDDVLQRAFDAGVKQVIIPATDLTTAREALDLAHQCADIFAAVGVHPNSTAEFEQSYLETIKARAQEPKVVAIGEIGLDYHWDKSPPEQQKVAFRAQLDLAAQLELPVIIHNREASDDVIEILETWVQSVPDSLKARPGVMHSFSAPAEIAQRALDIGFYLGFTGPVTFKNADELRRIAADAPVDRILVETDGPFLTPVPYRGKRNEPAYVPYIVERLASLHTMPVDEFSAQTTDNAVHLFGLPEIES